MDVIGTQLTNCSADTSNMLKNAKGQRNRCFDIAKGIGIILVVCGHARAPFQGFLSLFHMALFFMISGFLYNDTQSKIFRALWNIQKGR